jgi:DNA-binding HxlR family transcriptional regulator
MMRRQTYSCGLEAALDVIGGKWKTLILWHLDTRHRRFGELRRLVTGISEKMLIQQLRELEADGVVRRRAYQEIPPRVEYSLTDLGVSLHRALAPLCNWGTEHMQMIGAKHLRSATLWPGTSVDGGCNGDACLPQVRAAV